MVLLWINFGDKRFFTGTSAPDHMHSAFFHQIGKESPALS